VFGFRSAENEKQRASCPTIKKEEDGRLDKSRLLFVRSLATPTITYATGYVEGTETDTNGDPVEVQVYDVTIGSSCTNIVGAWIKYLSYDNAVNVDWTYVGQMYGGQTLKTRCR
jgi:hypothetical protein